MPAAEPKPLGVHKALADEDRKSTRLNSSHVRSDPVLQGTALDGDQDVDPDRAVVHLDALEHADVLDRLADLGVQHVPQRPANLVFGDQRQLLRIILIRTVRTVQIPMVRRSVGSVDAGG